MTVDLPQHAPPPRPPAGLPRMVRTVGHLCSLAPLACLLIWLCCLALYLKHNDFPTFFHTDEKHKVGFVLDGLSNFQHPMLLTQTARIFNNLVVNNDRDTAFVIGRSVSALFGATAVVLLMLVGWRLRGPAGGWAVGLTVGTSYFLMLLAHYMKEDPALLMGLAAVLLALMYVLERPTRYRLLALGAACALASSAKYAGLITLAPAVLVALGWRRGGPLTARLARVGWVLAAFVPVLLLINVHFILHPHEFLDGFNFEVDHVITGHHGLTSAPFGIRYLDTLKNEVQQPLAIMAVVYGLLFVARLRRRTPGEWAVLLFPIVWFILMANSRAQFSRYMLPVVVGMQLWAGLAALELASLARRRWLRAVLATALVLFVALPQGARAYDYLDQIQHDSRLQLASWAAKNLPETAVVLEDRYARLSTFKKLPENRKRLAFRTIEYKWAAQIGSLEDARKQGVTHIVVCSMSFGRLFNPWMEALPEEQPEIERQRNFYRELFNTREMLWACESKWPTRGNTNPRIFVYDLNRIIDPANGPVATPLLPALGGSGGELAEEGEAE